MITTRFGSEVEVLKPADDKGFAVVKRLSDGAERVWHVSELRCDTKEEMNLLMGDVKTPG